MPFPSPGDLSDPGIEPGSPTLKTDFLLSEHTLVKKVFIFINFLLVFPGGSVVKNLPAIQETQIQSLVREDPPEKGMATHSSILSWRIPWIEKPGRLHPWGLKELDTTEQLTLSLTFHITLSVYTIFCLSIRPRMYT